MKLKYIAASVLLVLSASALAEDKMNIGGTVRVNYRYLDYNQDSKDQQGKFAFDMFGIKFNAEKSNFGINAEYRLYNGGNLPKKAYFYYNGVPNWDFQLGVTQIPFGICDDSTGAGLADSFFGPLPGLVGLDDNYDAGFKASFKKGPWATDIAFFKNAERGSFGSDFRYGADIGDTSTISGINSVNLRQAYKFGGDDRYVILGGSLMLGQISQKAQGVPGDVGYVSNETSGRSAYAIHLDSKYDTWGFQAQFTSYDYDSNKITPNHTISMTDGYDIATKADIYTVNVNKSFPMDWGQVKVFNDYNMLKPHESGFDNSYQNIVGVVVDVYAIEVIAEYIFSKNTPDGSAGLGLSNPGADWAHTVNVNFAYYF